MQVFRLAFFFALKRLQAFHACQAILAWNSQPTVECGRDPVSFTATRQLLLRNNASPWVHQKMQVFWLAFLFALKRLQALHACQAIFAWNSQPTVECSRDPVSFTATRQLLLRNNASPWVHQKMQVFWLAFLFYPKRQKPFGFEFVNINQLYYHA